MKEKNVIQTSFVEQSVYNAAYPAVFANKVCSAVCIHFSYKDRRPFTVNGATIGNDINITTRMLSIQSQSSLATAQNNHLLFVRRGSIVIDYGAERPVFII